MFLAKVFLVLHIMCVHHVNAACHGVYECSIDQPYCSTTGCVSSCGEQYSDPAFNCVKFCFDDVYKQLIGTKETDSDDVVPQKKCVSKCPEHKPYDYNGMCVNTCPPDKPYMGLSSEGNHHPTCTDYCHYFVVDMKCNVCPDETKFIDGNKHCLNTSDCPAGTRIRDDVTYKKYGHIQCMSACDEYSVILNGQCIYKWDCEHPWIVYDDQCISECPVDFVSLNSVSGSCVRTWVLWMVGGILLLPALSLTIYWRKDFHGIYIRYLMVWKIKVRGIDHTVSKMATVDYNKMQSAEDVIEMDDIRYGIRNDEHFDGHDNQISEV